MTLAARMVLAFQAIVSREIDVNRPCVISVGSIQGGTTSNVIPDHVLVEATVRSHDDETRQALREKVERVVRGLAESDSPRFHDLALAVWWPMIEHDVAGEV